MSALPERTVEAAARVVYDEAACEHDDEVTTFKAHADRVIAAAMDPALGPDRLVVAGPFEQEVIEMVCAWLHRHRTWEGKADPIAAAFANAIGAHFIPSPERTP